MQPFHAELRFIDANQSSQYQIHGIFTRRLRAYSNLKRLKTFQEGLLVVVFHSQSSIYSEDLVKQTKFGHT